MSNTPRVNFETLYNQLRMYDSSEGSASYHLRQPEEKSERQTKYLLELELTALDFIRDELKELARDVESRSKQVAQFLDNSL